MREYTEYEIAILKRVVADYNSLAKEVREKINNGATYEDLREYIKSLDNCDLTNQEEEYTDFNYKDMTLSIYNDEVFGLYLGETIEVWNDKEYAYLDCFDNVGQIEKEIENGIINDICTGKQQRDLDNIVCL